MAEHSEKGQPQRATIAEQRLNPEIHLKEKITDPKRLAEIVLNTLDTTFNDKFFPIDERMVTRLMKNPSRYWSSIVSMVTRPAKKAALFVPQLVTINQALYLIETYDEALPISVSGNPPKTTVDRLAVEQLTEEKNAQNAEKIKKTAEERKDWTPEQRNKQEVAEQIESDKEVYANPVRRLARFISGLQKDTTIHKLTRIIASLELISVRNKGEHTPKLEYLIKDIIENMTKYQQYALYSRRLLKQYVQGTLPGEDTIKNVFSEGTEAIAAYLETFGAPEPPNPSRRRR